MSDWKSDDIRQAATDVRDALRASNQSHYALASALKNLKSALDVCEFVKFCMDQRDGLSIAANTAMKFERMIAVVKIIPAQKVWNKVGWGGVSKIAKIESRNERVAVCRQVVKGEKPIGKQKLTDLLDSHAPSYSAKQGVRTPSSGISRARAVRENELLKGIMRSWLVEFSVLKRELSPEIKEILGLLDTQVPRAS